MTQASRRRVSRTAIRREQFHDRSKPSRSSLVRPFSISLTSNSSGIIASVRGKRGVMTAFPRSFVTPFANADGRNGPGLPRASLQESASISLRRAKSNAATLA